MVYPVCLRGTGWGWGCAHTSSPSHTLSSLVLPSISVSYLSVICKHCTHGLIPPFVHPWSRSIPLFGVRTPTHPSLEGHSILLLGWSTVSSSAPVIITHTITGHLCGTLLLMTLNSVKTGTMPSHICTPRPQHCAWGMQGILYAERDQKTWFASTAWNGVHKWWILHSDTYSE